MSMQPAEPWNAKIMQDRLGNKKELEFVIVNCRDFIAAKVGAFNELV